MATPSTVTDAPRFDGRHAAELRETRITPHYIAHAEGSVLIEAGLTRVICTASVEDRVPPFLRGKGTGWVTGEYGMLRGRRRRAPPANPRQAGSAAAPRRSSV